MTGTDSSNDRLVIELLQIVEINSNEHFSYRVQHILGATAGGCLLIIDHVRLETRYLDI